MNVAAGEARGLTRAEVLRKVVHVGSLAPAVLLPWLSWRGALALALGGAVFGLLVLPRVGGRALWRAAERGRGLSVGIVLYPLSVVVLVLAFRDRLGIVAAGWALLALGDGCASLVGQAFGRHRLPWNADKSVEGLLAHVVAGSLGAAGLLLFVGDAVLTFAPVTLGVSPLALALAVGLAAATVSGLLESTPLGVDDNLVVPLSGAGVTWLLLSVAQGVPFWDRSALALQLAAGFGLSTVLSLAAWRRGSLSASGAVAAAGVGTLMLGAGSAAAFVVLLAFFAIGTGTTRLGRAVKEARGIAEARGGRRAVGNVLANGGLATAAALLIPGGGLLAADARIALVAALATAAFDTVSSEVGKAYGRVTLLATSLRRVPAGTEGAVSLEGTLAGLAAAALLAAVGLAGGLLPEASLAVLAVLVGAFVGTTVESVLGAAMAGRGAALDNDLINFLNTAVGAAAALAVVRLGSLAA